MDNEGFFDMYCEINIASTLLQYDCFTKSSTEKHRIMERTVFSALHNAECMHIQRIYVVTCALYVQIEYCGN